MKRIAVFHFNPLELYPPAMNFLDCLQRSLSENDRVLIYTTRPAVKTELYLPMGDQIIVKRITSYTQDLAVAKRMFQYLRYYLFSFLQCIRFRPSKVLYYETISSFTPYLLMKWPGSRIELFIHYHEYMNAEEYSRMFLNKIFHRLERKIYGRAKWISHTNKYRMQLFLKDLEEPVLTNIFIFPNYPPAAWVFPARDKITRPVKLVYVGAMGSLESLYLRETFEWIRCKSGAILLDIYSFNLSDDIKRFGTEMSCAFITWNGSAAYSELPDLLKQYDIGLILYKGTSSNIVYSASNKLFEYLACGLDVWYPDELKGSREYDSPTCWPKVVPLDFKELHQLDIDEIIDRKPGKRRHIDYTCETACDNLVTLLNA